MPLDVLLAVLFAALLHAAWNAFIKSGSNKAGDTVMLVTGAGAVAAAMLPLVPAPAAASRPFLAASVAIHCLYFYLVAVAYGSGDLSFAYPIMRGAAPLFTAVLTGLLLGEPIGKGGWLGILLLSAGILWMARDGLKSARGQKPALAIALMNALVIVAYTVVDGLGARASGNPWGYVLWMFFLNMFPFLALGLAIHGRAVIFGPAAGWTKGLAGGVCSVCAYGIVLWAMTRAPIAPVAALRETSVLFGTALGALLLKERFGPTRWLSAGLIAAGAAAMKVM